MIIGNVVTEDINSLSKFSELHVYKSVYITNNVSLVDKNLPTLYVGLSFLNKNNIDYNPIDKTITGKNCYWTYSNTEKYIDFINDTTKFFTNVKKYYWSNIKKINIDPIFNKIENSLDINKIIKNELIKLTIKNDIVYGFSDSEVYIINLNIFDFFGFNRNEIIDIFKAKKKD